MATIQEKDFILKLMEFVYQLSDKPLQHSLQELLDEFHSENGSYFTKNIAEVILEFVKEFNYSNLDIVDLSSPAYREKINKILKCYSHLDFLKFLTHYSLKSRIEYYDDKFLDSSTKFYSSILSFLREMKKNHRCDAKFWEELDLAAAEILGLKNLESSDSEYYESLNFEPVDMKSGEEFILVAMKVIYNFYRKPFPDCLQRKHDEVMLKSTTDFEPNVDSALVKVLENLENKVTCLGNDISIYEYFQELSTDKRFNGKHFLEFCACCTRRAVFESSPMSAYEKLFEVLQSAKQKGKFTSIEYLNRAAKEILQDYENKQEETKLGQDAACTDPYSDVSCESCSGIAPCDCPAIVFKKSSDDASQSADDKTIASSVAFHSAAENFTATGDFSQSATEKDFASCETPQSGDESTIASSEAFQSAAENVLTSSNSTQTAGESENLVSVHDHGTDCTCNGCFKDSCKCC